MINDTWKQIVIYLKIRVWNLDIYKKFINVHELKVLGVQYIRYVDEIRNYSDIVDFIFL